VKDEWIECPAFETNEFKVGDRVRVYRYHGGAEIGDALVTHVKNDDVEYGDYGAHFKQCRLLKKREAREWWVHTADFESNKKSIPMWYEKWKMDDFPGKWIKVREVID
jgi:hypothetical protein